MRDPTWWLAAGSVALLATGCPTPPSAPAVADEAPPVIEASGPARAQSGPKPIGENDPEAQTCLAVANEAKPDTPCRDEDPAACAAQCRAGDPSACRTFAGGLGDDEAACRTKLRRLACDRDELAACTDLAASGATDDAAALAERACEGRYARGCWVWGLVTDDETEALHPYAAACELGDAEGCVAAASQYNGGEGVDRDQKTGAQRLERACELGHLDACVDLGLARVFGRGVPRDVARARQLLEQVCGLDGEGDGGRSCATLAALSPQLATPTQGAPPIEPLLERSCEKGYLDGCQTIAHTHYSAGRFDQAVEAANKAIVARPDTWQLRYARGLSLFNLGRFAEAATDFEALCPLKQDLPYCPLWLYAARERAGQDGKSGLRESLAKLPNDEWPEPIFRYHLGRLSEAGLLREARDPKPQRQLEKECEAYYYVAQQLLIDGRDKRAITMLHKTVETNITNFIEYTGAQAELARLGITR